MKHLLLLLGDLPSHEAAVEWAARDPIAPFGSVEIRPAL
jgi:hypothetical protein